MMEQLERALAFMLQGTRPQGIIMEARMVS